MSVRCSKRKEKETIMKKSNFVAMILGTIGVILFALGMCLTMVWGNMITGILVGIVGIVLLLCLISLTKGLG